MREARKNILKTNFPKSINPEYSRLKIPVFNMKPRSWMILILSIGTIAVAIGILLKQYDDITRIFNIDPSSIIALQEFLEQYLAGLYRF